MHFKHLQGKMLPYVHHGVTGLVGLSCRAAHNVRSTQNNYWAACGGRRLGRSCESVSFLVFVYGCFWGCVGDLHVPLLQTRLSPNTPNKYLPVSSLCAKTELWVNKRPSSPLSLQCVETVQRQSTPIVRPPHTVFYTQKRRYTVKTPRMSPLPRSSICRHV